jgi:hypothetical protein
MSPAAQAATQHVIRSAIAADLGVQANQIVITRVTTTDSRRRLSTSHTTTVEYDVSVDPAVTSPEQIRGKIVAGDVKGSTVVSKAAASSSAPQALKNLSADQITSSTAATTRTIAAAAMNSASSSTNSDSPTTDSGSSSSGKKALEAAEIAGIAIVSVLIVLLLVVHFRKKSAGRDSVALKASSGADTA